jgi:hypothetical protein
MTVHNTNRIPGSECAPAPGTRIAGGEGLEPAMHIILEVGGGGDQSNLVDPSQRLKLPGLSRDSTLEPTQMCVSV